MQLIDLIAARNVFDREKNTRVKAALAYKIMKFLKQTTDDAKFYFDRIKSICETYGAKDSDGKLKIESGSIVIKKDGIVPARKEIEELEKTEVETPVFFSIEELSELKLSVADMECLCNVIK